MSTDDEFKRVLANPENVIVSEELSGLVDESEADLSSESFLVIDEDFYFCKVEKLNLQDQEVIFSLDVPSFSFRSLLVSNSLLQVHLDDLQYQQVPSTNISWEDNLLTLKTRRIFNEAV